MQQRLVLVASSSSSVFLRRLVLLLTNVMITTATATTVTTTTAAINVDLSQATLGCSRRDCAFVRSFARVCVDPSASEAHAIRSAALR